MSHLNIAAIPKQSLRETIRASNHLDIKAAIARGEFATWEGTLQFIRSTSTRAQRRQRIQEIRHLMRRGGHTDRDRWLAEGSLQLLLAAAAPAERS